MSSMAGTRGVGLLWRGDGSLAREEKKRVGEKGGKMANPEHLAILGQGVEVWNKWREENPNTEPDLSDMDFRDKNFEKFILKGTNFTSSSLKKCNLTRMDFTLSIFSHCNLQGAKLFHSDFAGSEFYYADLRGADLFRADLSLSMMDGADFGASNLIGTTFQATYLRRAKFDEAYFHNTIIADVDLSEALGLDKARHLGPSAIGVDTICRSEGKIDPKFMQGCGVPEDFIELIQRHFPKPFKFSNCFISHSTKDKPFCEQLYADLQNNGVRCWYFPEDARWGQPVWGERDKSIKIYDKLLVVCSENSLQSGPVQREIERALQREDSEDSHILFPIRIDEYLFEEWEHPRKADVTAKVVGDFRGWESDPAIYQKALDRLLRDLKASEE